MFGVLLNVLDDNEQGLYDYNDVLYVNEKNNKMGYDTEETEFEEEEKVVDANILLARAIIQLSKSLKIKDKPTGRESKVVDFPEFYGGDQDPIEWIEGFERACVANNVDKKRKLKIAKAYLKGEAQTWIKRLRVGEWFDPTDHSNSFRHQFKEKYCGTFTRTIWKQKLRNLKQKPGETIESYYAKIVELWHRIDPADLRPESDKVQEFIEGLRTEFVLPVQTAMPNPVQAAVNTAKAAEIGLAMNNKRNYENPKNRNFDNKFDKGKTPIRF